MTGTGRALEDRAPAADSLSPSTSSCPAAPSSANLDALLAKWRAGVAARFQSRRSEVDAAGEHDDSAAPPPLDRGVVLPVWRSVFAMSDECGKEGAERNQYETLDHQPPMPHDEFDDLVQQVRRAIAADIHPRLNAKGSSGSYFARDVSGRTLGIFKPADEEPYGTLNPKLVKWVHREFLARVIPFGRACLAPGQSYLSEAAACIVDAALGTHIVPRTEVVRLASPAFFYDWVDRERAARGHPLREKAGSFQVFLEGFTDASAFLTQHPFPGRPVACAAHPAKRDGSGRPPRRRGRSRGCVTASLLCLCGRTGAEWDDAAQGDGRSADCETVQPRKRSMRVAGEDGTFVWTADMIHSFREELEKLVVLDFLIRNTDRGLDNFMLKPCSLPCARASPASPPKPHLHLAAIDNSLAFPHQHPSGWRTYTYGWLYLPLSLVGQPWSARARVHFLPLLRDPAWWANLKVLLRSEFVRDRAFGEEMWERQWSVLKGQGYLLVQSLRSADEGPVELCRRPKQLVHDDYCLVPVPSALPHISPPAPTRHSHRRGSAPPLALEATATADNGLLVAGNSSDDEAIAQPQPHRRPRLAERHSVPVRAIPHDRTMAAAAATQPHRTPVAGAGAGAPPVVARHQHRRQHGGQLEASISPSTSPSASRAPRDALTLAPAGDGDGTGNGDGEGEQGEETGVALLARLDRVEADARRRLWRARRDARARAALEGAGADAGTRTGAVSDGEGEGEGVKARRRWFGRREETATSASVAGTSIARGVDAVGERRWLLDGAIDEEDEEDDEDEGDGEVDGRMVMSWYGGQCGASPRELDEVERAADRGAPSKMQWTVIERLEDVKEVPRRWPWRW
ncbi:hypothetical protein JCM3770_005297 [Rhodotorula araucariae]